MTLRGPANAAPASRPGSDPVPLKLFLKTLQISQHPQLGYLVASEREEGATAPSDDLAGGFEAQEQLPVDTAETHPCKHLVPFLNQLFDRAAIIAERRVNHFNVLSELLMPPFLFAQGSTKREIRVQDRRHCIQASGIPEGFVETSDLFLAGAGPTGTGIALTSFHDAGQLGSKSATLVWISSRGRSEAW